MSNPTRRFLPSPIRIAVAGTALVALAAGSLALTLVGGTSAGAQSPLPPVVNPRSITVHGVGRISQTPDQATVVIGVETRAATAAAALTANSTKANQLIATLKSNGIAPKDIQTSNLSVYPQYDNQGRRITGYQVTNTVTATVKDLKNAGTLIDAAAAVAGDAFRVNGLSFSISDNAKPLASARAAAVADARAQADQLATAAGVKLGQLRTFSSSSSSVPTPVFRDVAAAKTMAADSAVPIEAGSQEVTAEVDLVFDMS